MKISGGTLSILLSATAVAASVFQNTPVVSKNGLQSRSLFGVAKSNYDVVNAINAIPRGGSDSESDNAEADVPEVLYLPGLLGATVGKKTVSSFLVLMYM